MIQFNNVSKVYPNGRRALDQLTFSIRSGELALLVGPSGAGKTTLLKLLLGLTPPSEGNIFINKHNLNQINAATLPQLRRNIGMIFQSAQLLAEETVYYNVALPLQLSGFKTKEIAHRTQASLQKLNLLSKATLKAGTLSSGEQKLTEIARAIVTMPRILLVDEPTANIDPQAAQGVLRLLLALRRLGVTLIVATHQPDLFKQETPRILLLNKGCLQQEKQHHVLEKERI